MRKRLCSWLLVLTMVLGLFPSVAFAQNTVAEGETITVTVTMDTRVVAEDVSSYGMTALPASVQVSVDEGATVAQVMQAWADGQDIDLTIDNTYGPYITEIGPFGAYGTQSFQALCASAGLDPVPDIFQYAGWTYTLNGTYGAGIGTDTVHDGNAIDFRYGLYMTSGIWQQVDHAFLDAYDAVTTGIAAATSADRSNYSDTQWQTLQTALADAQTAKTAIDDEAFGLWMNYFADKQTALWGTGSPTDQLEKAAKALQLAIDKVIAPTGVAFAENNVEIPLNRTYTIPFTVTPEGAPQNVTYEAFLGETAFTVSDAGVITPTAKNNLCWVKVACKDAPDKFDYFKFKIIDAVPDVPAIPLTALSGETQLPVSKSEKPYTYTVVTEYDENWNPVKTEERTVDLYVVSPDAEVSEVTLDFGEEACIAYTYDGGGNYLGACGDYGDGTTGQTTAKVTDLTAYVRVQTPYDASWQSEFLYAVAFDLPSPAPSAPFTALSGETQLPASKSETPYTYTVVTEYDENWNPVKTEERSADLYVICPDVEISEVTLDFGEEERIAYTYDVDGNYLGACGDYGDGTTGQTTAKVTDLTAYVRVQTPYDASWNSELLYAVAFDVDEEDDDDPAPSTVSVEALLTNIAAGYTDNSTEWVILDMAAYKDTVSGAQSQTSDTAKQTYIDSVITSVTADDAEEADYAKAILVLQAIGADPQKLYPKNNRNPVSAVAGLKGLESHSSSAWVAPYTLAALNQGTYGTQDLEQSILSAVLTNQAEDGSWSEWGDSIQTTANMIAGLAFYYGKEDAVTAAVDKAVSFLSLVQKENGGFDAYGSGADSNTVAMVVIGLSALGIDPDTDERFIKNEKSALDALLAFALADNSGFGYTNNTAINSYSTEQAFRALVAANAVTQTGKAYNVYDFSTNEVAPAYAGGKPSGGGGGSSGGGGSTSNTIKVYFTLKTHQTTWISKHRVTVDKGAGVGDLFRQVLDSRSGFSYVDKGGYISSITKDGITWSEFDAGPNSGWKYTVNGTAPGVGMNDRTLKSGDEVVWYYVADYTTDPTPDEGGSTKPSVSEKEEGKDEPKPDTPEVQEPVFAFTDVEGHWAKDAIRFVYGKGLMVGTSETTFEPETTGSRGMIMTILHNLDGNPEYSESHSFADVENEKYYSGAISWAVTSGIVSGYGNGQFGPDDDVTREQLAVILRQYAKVKGYDVSKSAELTAFMDSDRVSPWAQEALEWACGQGLMSGKGGSVLDPGGRATRAEVATILMNFMEKVMK